MSDPKSHITLSQLNTQIEDAINARFQNHSFWVIGEVSSYSFYKVKHIHYFDFVEKDEHTNKVIAKISSAAFGRAAESIANFWEATGQQFTNGLQVLLKVKVNFHKAYGLQLVVEDIDYSFTLGKLEQERRATLLRLETECSAFIQKRAGVFHTRNKSKPIPYVIQHIAVISSSNSAGYYDFKDTLLQNSLGYQFKLDNYFSTMQGAGNAALLVQKLIDIYNTKIPYDAVVIIRGGGSQTDFLLYDQFIVARAVAKFPIPIITGIGHHKDVSITDLMAHSPTKTPTQAAEFILNRNRSFEESIIALQKKVVIKAQQICASQHQEIQRVRLAMIKNTKLLLSDHKDKLVTLNTSVIHQSRRILFAHKTALTQFTHALLTKPSILIAQNLGYLEYFAHSLKLNSGKYLLNLKGYLNHYKSVFKLISPNKIMKMGFSLIFQDGEIISDPLKLQEGSNIQIRLKDEQLESKVLNKNQTHEPPFEL